MPKIPQKIHERPAFAALIVLIVLAVVALVLTRESGQPTPASGQPQRAGADQPTIDQSPLQTAQVLAQSASTAEERQFAQEALRLADHEVDLAYNTALREAGSHPAPLTPETRDIAARIKQLEALVKEEKDHVSVLTKRVAAASDDEKEAAKQRLDIAQAQLDLDQEELNDAKQDLIRAGGDKQGKIQRMLDEHEALMHSTAGSESPAAAAGGNQGQLQESSLLAQLRAWGAVHLARNRVRNAQQDAINGAAVLARDHQALEQEIKQEKSKPSASGSGAATASPQIGNGAIQSNSDATAALTSLHHLSNDQRTLSDFDKRIQDERELSEVYGAWAASLSVRQRAILHAIIQAVLAILLIILLVLVSDHFIDRFFLELRSDRRRLLNLRVVLRFAVQAVAVLLGVFIVFGRPGQISTILGLAGAGLTVALKDFVVAFFGWFVLMGRDGIRVGDWVEINGVGGEVVEIGLLRTLLLETGNWHDAGHPTGRKVAFVNSFAIEGHFFNFSTSGQWLWDEIQLVIPASADPYSIVDQIRKIVTDETEANAKLAEKEWERVTRRYGMKTFAATPAVDVRPSGDGVQVIVRYITRANERYEVRSRLYQAIVKLLNRKHMGTVAKELVVKSAAESD